VRELTNSLKTSALASQKVSESAVKKVESTDSLLKKLKDSFHSLFGRVTRLEAEVLPPKPTTVVYEKPKPPGTPDCGYVVDPDDRVRVPDSPVIRIYTGPSFLARHKVTGALSWVATFTQGFSDRFFEQILFATLVHPTLLGTIGFSLPGGTREATIVTEYMPHGSLDTLIKDTARYAALSPTAKAKIAVGIVLGMRYLHACDVIHRDLKPSHILLDENYEPRILTKRIANDFEPSSYFYIAPEVFKSETAHGKAVDAFSFGMILWEIITGKPVMTGYKVRKDPGCVAHLKRVSQCVRPTTDGMEPLTDTLLEATWGTDPSDRANFSEILDLLKQDHYEIIPGIDDGEVARYVKGIEDYEAAHPPIPLAVEDEEE
jgi:serine/threonine protein kinase